MYRLELTPNSKTLVTLEFISSLGVIFKESCLSKKEKFLSDKTGDSGQSPITGSILIVV